jgi:hypothetical protein
MKKSLQEGAYDDEEKAAQDIAQYIELVEELSEKDVSPQILDFMAVCSSVLLFADNTIEYKIDWLYQWITIGKSKIEWSISLYCSHLM